MNNENSNPPPPPGPPSDFPPFGGVKVKIKDGNTSYYITYNETTGAIATSMSSKDAFPFDKTTVGDKQRLAFPDGYYLASDGNNVVRSNPPTTPEWTYTSAKKMYFHEYTLQHIAVDNHGTLSIGRTGSDVEFE